MKRFTQLQDIGLQKGQSTFKVDVIEVVVTSLLTEHWSLRVLNYFNDSQLNSGNSEGLEIVQKARPF